MNWKMTFTGLMVFSLLITGTAFAAPDFPSAGFDEAVWRSLSISDRQEAMAKVRFDLLQERRPELKNTLDAMRAFRDTRIPLSSDNMLKIPLRPGRLEVSAMFKKAEGEIVQCDMQKFVGVFDVYRMEVVPDPVRPGQVLARISGGNNPNVPTTPVPAQISTDGRTAKITVGADWLSITSDGGESYKIKTNRVPVTIKAKYID